MTDSPTPSKVVRDRIEQLRNRRGWSQQELADRMNELDHMWDRTTVAKVEAVTKPRQVTIDELVALAYVFGVPVVALLTPPDGMVRISPNTVTSAGSFWSWATGMRPDGGSRVGEGVVPNSDTDVERRRFYEEAKPAAFVTAEERLPGILDMVRRSSAVAVVVGAAAPPSGFLPYVVDALEQLGEDVKDLRRRARRLEREGPPS